MLSTVQAARRVGIGRDTLHRWMKDGRVIGPEITTIGGVKVRLWSDRDIRKLRQFKTAHHWEGRGRPRKAKVHAKR
jgi:predicted site-specific integrase-resolvase